MQYKELAKQIDSERQEVKKKADELDSKMAQVQEKLDRMRQTRSGRGRPR